jgi:hypothetical protein
MQERRSGFDVEDTRAIVTQTLEVKYKMLQSKKVSSEMEMDVALETG